jgi:DNA repair photolyase
VGRAKSREVAGQLGAERGANMINKPIYEPKGKAREYGELALNIYTGCNHGCTYCYARKMSERYTSKDCISGFGSPKPRNDIIESVKKQLSNGKIKGRIIHLCFSCDPYPAEIDTTPTRDIISAIKESGNHVQILTKGGIRAERDFDLLDDKDFFGVTYTGYGTGYLFIPSPEEPNTAPPSERLASLDKAHKLGIKTWMSCEPVLDEQDIYTIIECAGYVDLFKIGKLNYYPSSIDWAEFGRKCERICKQLRRDYYIKTDLRAIMEGKA